MATIGTIIYTALKGRQVGKDSLGNRYYEAKNELTSHNKKKRWVMYKGTPEASSVPPEWHGWLHYTTDEMPNSANTVHYKWMKPSQPNLTGSPHAYMPSGHASKNGTRAATIADYQPWKPE